MTEKIIFLDIDGPMIPYTSFLFNRHASWEQVLDERCVAVLRRWFWRRHSPAPINDIPGHRQADGNSQLAAVFAGRKLGRAG